MRVNSWSTMRPEPIFMWPVSELPICLAGNPTSMPDAFSRVRGYLSHKWSHTGFLALWMAL